SLLRERGVPADVGDEEGPDPRCMSLVHTTSTPTLHARPAARKNAGLARWAGLRGAPPYAALPRRWNSMPAMPYVTVTSGCLLGCHEEGGRTPGCTGETSSFSPEQKAIR